MVAASRGSALLHLKMVTSHSEGQPAEWVSGDPPQAADTVGVALRVAWGGEVTYWSKMDPSTQWGFWEKEGKHGGEFKRRKRRNNGKRRKYNYIIGLALSRARCVVTAACGDC